MGLTHAAGVSQHWRHACARLARLWPSQCLVCHAWPQGPLCADCLARHAATVQRCPGCALARPTAGLPCGQCLRHPAPWAACLAAVDYGFPWSALLARFKFQAEPGLAGPLGQLLRNAPGVPEALAQADWIIPMPLSATRLQARGYNQTLLLARALDATRCHPQWLLRTRHGEAQSHLTRTQRLANLHGAFTLAPGCAPRLQGRRVLLLDDVMTTGATLRAAAAPLQAAGAHITALVLARTPEGRG